MPYDLKAKLMLWTHVSYHDMEEIDNMESIPDLESILCRVLGVDLPEPKRGVLLELYVQAVLFTRENSFKKEQTSALLSIIKSIHDANVETPLNNLEHCLKYCKELLLTHSVRRPPFSIALFSAKEVNCIFEYIYNNYLRHYKLYKYVFTPQIKLDLSLTYTENLDPEDFSAPEGEVLPEKGVFPETQETPNTNGPTSEVKTLNEKEVREQMMLVSGQLDH
uniref:Si:ch73-81k8.2 n=2 Tax=Echeneis naucrates TaxID=173247 RepID=A0A665UVN9_ECHNA